MKNLLFVIPSMVKAGGSEKLVDSLSELLSTDFTVSVVSFDVLNSDRYFKNSIPFYSLGYVKDLPLPLRWINYFIYAYKLRSIKKRLNIDLTISILWRADFINILSNTNDAKFSLGVINVANNPTNYLMQRFQLFVGWVYQRFDFIFAINPSLAEELCIFYRLVPHKVKIFRNFLTVKIPPPVLTKTKKVRFVFCGRFVQEKNIEGIIHIWANFVRVRAGRQLILIGDGVLLEDIKSLVNKHRLSIGNTYEDDVSDVIFVGAQQHPESFMVDARAFLLTSRHEGVPTVLLLASALGLPILAADSHGGGVRHLLGLSPQAPVPSCVAAGMVLPIPESFCKSSVEIWVRTLLDIDQDNKKYLAWRDGAFALANRHSPEEIRIEWLENIKRLPPL